MASMTALKKDLRKRIKAILKEFPEAAAVTQTTNATKTLLSTPEYKAARRIIRDALAQGKQVFIPYTYKLNAPKEGQPRSIMDMLQLHSMQDFESLKPDNWGIPTPSEDSLSSRTNSFGGKGVTDGKDITIAEGEEGLDLIVMPGMAFDSSFGRLGHGKGFYDYFLHRCHDSSRMPFRVGLALTEQLLPSSESVPMDTSDFRLDALVTGDGELHRAPT